jgi:H+/Cl- antiporter ClcA
MAVAENRTGKRKWSLWRAALYGLILAVITFITSNLANEGKELSIWLQARPAEMIAYFGARLLAAPLLFVLIAFICNRFVKTS